MVAALAVVFFYTPDLASPGPAWVYFLYLPRHILKFVAILPVCGSIQHWIMWMGSRRGELIPPPR
jgi:hypothetical protein